MDRETLIDAAVVAIPRDELRAILRCYWSRVGDFDCMECMRVIRRIRENFKALEATTSRIEADLRAAGVAHIAKWGPDGPVQPMGGAQ